MKGDCVYSKMEKTVNKISFQIENIIADSQASLGYVDTSMTRKTLSKNHKKMIYFTII